VRESVRSAVVRIGVVLEQLLSPVPGGTGRYAAEVAEALARRPEVAVTGWVAWHRDVGPATRDGVSGPRRLALPRRPLIAAWERGLGPDPRAVDVLHAPTLLAPPRRSRPLVVTVHDAVPWTHPETLTPRGVRWHRAMAERVARTADAVVVPTHAVRRALEPHLRLPHVVVVGEGVTPGLRALPADAEARRRRLDLPDSGYLLSLATLEPRKGLDVPAGRVRPLGRLPDADLAVVLRDATALVVPSRAEGYGLPVLEGMAAGTPVVTSDDPALVEVGADATRTAPVGDAAALARALAAVTDDAAMRAQMVSAGYLRAAATTWDSAAGELVSLYEGLA